MRKPNDQLQKLIVAVIITSLFLIFHQSTTSSSNNNHNSNQDEYYYDTKPQAMQESFFSRSRSRIIKVPNSDASLSIPYLDKINKYWHIGGSTQVRNSESVKLTSKNVPHTHGSIISNGIGDNTMNDFEVVFDFKLTYDDPTTIGDGVAFVITSENGFLLKDLTSSFAMRQYMINSGGILANDISMMGFPQNLPGLALVIDTFANDPVNKQDIPFLDIFVNFNPQRHSYHIESDGHKSSNRRLNDHHIPLKKNILQHDRIKLRIIYMESISFLKIDIQYETEGDYWIELYQNNNDPQGNKHFLLPKNDVTGQRFIGMSAVNGDLTENVELFNIKTSEFHWNNGDESMESTFDYFKECENFLLQEFNQRIKMEKDSYTRWKMVKSQPNYKDQLNEKINQDEQNKKPIELPQGINQHKMIPKKSNDPLWKKIIKLMVKWIIIFICIVTFYLLSIYIRVSKKHWKKLRSKNRKKSSHDYILPI